MLPADCNISERYRFFFSLQAEEMSEITSSLFQHCSHKVTGKFGEQIEVEEKKELPCKIRIIEW